jgi:hypothetical protein
MIRLHSLVRPAKKTVPAVLRQFLPISFLVANAVLLGSAVLRAEAAAPLDRYQPRDPSGLTVPRTPVTRKDYVDLVRPMARGFDAGPDRGMYGPRHALPALAVFALEGDVKLGHGIKRTLRHYADWVHGQIKKEKGVFSMEGPTLCAFYFRELRKQELMTPDDEQWAKDLLLALRQYQCAWRPGDGLWRGSHHRSQCQGINHALAAAFYPGEPDVPKWKAYSAKVWADWWDFRDVGINDTGYFYSSFTDILRAAELLGRTEVFCDPQSRKLFDRIVFELTPDGAAIPYGASGGYHGAAGERILALELAARHTRDGRYRWAAHRLMNYGQARGFSNGHHHLNSIALENISLASLVCDDTVQPVEPEAASQLLTRKEIVRLTDAQAKAMFPEAGGVDCNMFMTQKVLPSKLVMRSGWQPGDLTMMVECYVRHDPLNPTAIVGLERQSAAFAEMTSEKFVSRENAVHVADLSGTATYLAKKGFKGKKDLPLGWAGMESSVPEFSDSKAVTHALVRVTKYMGYEAAHDRDILFVKNRFVLLRDETTFDDNFRASVGPAWNTQHVGTPQGAHWMNTWFTAHWFQTAKLYDVPPWDLLIWHAPKSAAKVIVEQAPIDTPFASRLLPTRYAWEGDVTPGMRLQFVTLLLPHAPTRDATPLAGRITVLRDTPGVAAVKIAEGERTELAVLNAACAKLELDAGPAGKVATDGRALFLEFHGARLTRGAVIEGTYLTTGAKSLFRSEKPAVVELPEPARP